MNFNKLIPDLKDWNNGAGASIDAWLGFHITAPLAIAHSTLFWPEFIEYKGCVFSDRNQVNEFKFLKESFSEWDKAFKGDKTRIEAMMNHRHILDILGSPDINTNLGKPHPTKEQVLFLGRALKEIWECKLKRDFPKRKFIVEFYEKNIKKIQDYELTFYQARKGS